MALVWRNIDSARLSLVSRVRDAQQIDSSGNVTCDSGLANELLYIRARCYDGTSQKSAGIAMDSRIRVPQEVVPKQAANPFHVSSRYHS